MKGRESFRGHNNRGVIPKWWRREFLELEMKRKKSGVSVTRGHVLKAPVTLGLAQKTSH